MFGACVVRLMAVLFSIYLLLWIQSFAQSGAGTSGSQPVITRMEGKNIYMNIMIISVLISGVVFPVVGILCDHITPKIVIPFAFLFRAAFVGCFMFVAVKPFHTDTYVCCVMMVIGTIIENISTDTIFYQNLQRETRAILTGMYAFCGLVGIFCYSLTAGYMFDTIGKKSPFMLICILDLSYAFIVLMLIPCGLFNEHERKR